MCQGVRTKTPAAENKGCKGPMLYSGLRVDCTLPPSLVLFWGPPYKSHLGGCAIYSDSCTMCLPQVFRRPGPADVPVTKPDVIGWNCRCRSSSRSQKMTGKSQNPRPPSTFWEGVWGGFGGPNTFRRYDWRCRETEGFTCSHRSCHHN